MPLVATRLLDHPIIRPHMDRRMGGNINSPALIRMPDWAGARPGRYHLYFSDHKGRYIRLAYANALTGPWRMHGPGVLDVADSPFEATDPPEPAPEDRPAWSRKMPSDPVTLLEPELPWEGVDLPLGTSVMGGLDRRVRELRDACVFADADGATYLLYCGGGESGIGLARLTGI